VPTDTASLRRIDETLARGESMLRAAGVDGARRDCRLLLAEALGCGPAQVFGYPERPVSAVAAERFEAMIARRAAREPVSRILGRREFWSLDFRLARDTLDPRPDSETLVATLVERLAARRAESFSLLDLGTGSGCLLLALLTELPAACGVGIDVAEGAVDAARENAAALGLADRAAFRCVDWTDKDWTDRLDGPFDVVLSNPPYISSAEIADLDPEVARYDPARALDGGADGLDAYRTIVAALPFLLRDGGTAAFEVGDGQADDVLGLLATADFEALECVRDLSGVARCVLARAVSRS
jgi:release factor glutamine methyltransferase